MPRFVIVTGALGLLSLFLTFAWVPFALDFAIPAVALISVSIAGEIVWKRRSRYDLSALRDLHESGGPPPEDDLPEVAEDAGVVCPCCGTVYGAWMLICPNCKR